jgi:SAM-dependent methyltransferase
MADNFLDKAYGVKSVDEVRTLYDDWSDSYDDEMEANGYATPRRCSEALAGCSSDLAAPILDFGCGTGRSGLALKAAGFSTIDGADLSDDMLKGARDRGLYRTLWQVDPDADLPVTPGDYAAITAIGVIGAGAAPLEVFDTLLTPSPPVVYSSFRSTIMPLLIRLMTGKSQNRSRVKQPSFAFANTAIIFRA